MSTWYNIREREGGREGREREEGEREGGEREGREGEREIPTLTSGVSVLRICGFIASLC
jgi:hypothetical protein